MLFRFRMLPRIWALLLILVNAASLLFLNTGYGQANLAAVAAAILVMAIIYARLGFVRLLGVGHVLLDPHAALVCRTSSGRLFRSVALPVGDMLNVFNSISLVIDTIDVVRFVRGDREPHYRWKTSDASSTSIAPDS